MKKRTTVLLLSLMTLLAQPVLSQERIELVDRPSYGTATSGHYLQSRAPLLPWNFLKLPVGKVRPEGWTKAMLLRQKEGLNGHLSEISAWLDKENNAWLGTGTDYGWEEVPYWLKGYANMAYILGDRAMITEAKVWIEAVLKSQREDGYFGPWVERNGSPDLWGNMIMLWCLRSYYEYTRDTRVLPFMTRYFRWQAELPDEHFLQDYWENSRGGDNLDIIYWLYAHTGESFLLDLAKKTHENTADWTQRSTLPNWHNVNIAQCFREPATYYLQTKDSTDLLATYNTFHLIRNTFGQVPGGMFGADENARMGYIDPRQGTETCGFVEQMASDEILLRYTGDPFWAEHCEEIMFNSYPAALMPDFKSLRYITSPNHTISDARDHHPGIDNRGPFLAMNPFSSRCCQHNHGQGVPYYIEHLILATGDQGIAACIYGPCSAEAVVADGVEVKVKEETQYPFSDRIDFVITPEKSVRFPLYLRIPGWTEGATLYLNGKKEDLTLIPGKYARIDREWRRGDRVTLYVPMTFREKTWQANHNSMSVSYGPLTLSLLIKERYKTVDTIETAIGDSKWQPGADASKWPSYEIFPESTWSYALYHNRTDSVSDHYELVHRPWPKDDFPFTTESCPILVRTKGREVLDWGIDRYGLTAELPTPESLRLTKEDTILTLVPMGAARLRISAFPTINNPINSLY